MTSIRSLHERIVDLHRHVGSGHFGAVEFCIDKAFGVWVFDVDAEHQSARRPS